MKKIIFAFITLALLSLSFRAAAAPAYPYPIKVTQPDGSTITIQMHGDEFYSWITDGNGRIVEKNAEGFYRPVSGARQRQMAPAAARAREQRAQMQKSFAPRKTIGSGTQHFLVVLVEFNDIHFQEGASTNFSNLLNQSGYSDNGATGSVKNYYYDNSNEQFDPVFNVVGPFRSTRDHSAFDRYGRAGSNPSVWKEIIDLADPTVNFASYDLDDDTYVDNIFFYFAGHNQAEGAGADLIWPHASGLTGTVDGKNLGHYACTSELKGNEGTEMCGIGTFCHEFAHVLGLPDFYDIDYDTNGRGPGLYGFSLMSAGNYNNNGKTPPCLTAIERELLGWMPSITEWTTAGSKTIEPISSNVAYWTPTNVEGEYFVYEVRGGTSVWDTPSYLGLSEGGLLIYHVDKSSRMVAGYTAAQRWDNWDINSIGDHPCIRIIPSTVPASGYDDLVYAGATGVDEFSETSTPAAVDWDGAITGYNLTDITQDGYNVTLTLSFTSTKRIKGTVTDANGLPVSGATVEVSAVSPAPRMGAPASMSVAQIRRTALVSTTTAADGTYTIDLTGNGSTSYNLSVSKTLYTPVATTVDLTMGEITKDITLYLTSDPVPADLKKYNSFSGYGWGSGSSPCSGTAMVRFTTTELASFVGNTLNTISFEIGGSSASEIKVVAYLGTDKVVDLVVDSPLFNAMNTVDVSSFNVTIDGTKDLYFGYAFSGADYGYPCSFEYVAGDANGSLLCVFSDDDTWYDALPNNLNDNSTEGNLIVSATLLSNPLYGEFPIIRNPNDGIYTAGDTYYFQLTGSSTAPVSVSWTFDGAAVADPASGQVLSAGDHVIEATLTYGDGKVTIIEQEIRVNP